MKILVTGSSGFVGKNLIENIEKENEIVLYDIKEGRDILDTKLLSDCLNGVDTVVHLAALVSAIESWEKPFKYFRTNGEGTLNVVTAAIQKGVKRIIFASSAAVYGNPLTPYGASKKWAEDVLSVYSKQIEVVPLRFFNIYGLNQNPAYGYVIHNFIKGIKEDGRIDIFGDGKQSRDFIYINDVIKVIIYFLNNSNKVPTGAIDIGTGESVTVLKLADKIGNILNKKYAVNLLPKREEPRTSQADLSGLIKCGFDIKQFLNVEAGLKKLMRF